MAGMTQTQAVQNLYYNEAFYSNSKKGKVVGLLIHPANPLYQEFLANNAGYSVAAAPFIHPAVIQFEFEEQNAEARN